MNINDAINAAIVDVGTANAINDKLLRYYLANGAVSLDINDAEWEFLIAQGAGHAIGLELVVDPFFSSTVAWAEGVGWVAGGNKATIDGSNPGTSNLTNSSVGVVIGNTYELTLRIKHLNAGSIVAAAGLATVTPAYTTPGLHRKTFTASGTGAIFLIATANTIAEVEEFSVRGVTLGDGVVHQIADMWDHYLRITKGYSGSLNDMLYQYWTTGPRP